MSVEPALTRSVDHSRGPVQSGQTAVLFNVVAKSFLNGQPARCIPELTYHSAPPATYEGGLQDQRNLIACWERLDIEVLMVNVNDVHGDGCFVQDTMLVLEDLIGGGYAAVELNPGDEYRKAEVGGLKRALAPFAKEVIPWSGGGCIEGGDIFPAIRTGPQSALLPVWLRLPTDHDAANSCSLRTAADGIATLEERVKPLGYTLGKFEFWKRLHATSRMSLAGRDDHGVPTVVADPRFLPEQQTERLAEHGIRTVVLPESLYRHSWFAANIPCVGGKRVGSSIPEVREFLSEQGLAPDEVLPPMYHMARQRGSATCLMQCFQPPL